MDICCGRPTAMLRRPGRAKICSPSMRRSIEGLGPILDDIESMNAVFVLFAVHGMARDISRTAQLRPSSWIASINSINRKYRRTAAAASPAKRDAISSPGGSGAAPARDRSDCVPVGVRDWVVGRATAAGHDWSRTPGLALLADRTGYIRLNRQGREAEGILHAGSAEEEHYTATIEMAFREPCRCRDRRKIVADVLPRAALFSGARADYLPDLFVTWREHESSSRAQVRSSWSSAA